MLIKQRHVMMLVSQKHGNGSVFVGVSNSRLLNTLIHLSMIWILLSEIFSNLIYIYVFGNIL